MAFIEPKELTDVLERLERRRVDPQIESQRIYRRFDIRAEARLDPMNDDDLAEPAVVQLRNISRGGVGFLSPVFLEPCSLWRLVFKSQGQVAGTQPICVRFCRFVQTGLYVAGAQFLVEPHILVTMGVSPNDLTDDVPYRCDPRDVSDFMPPETVE